MFYTLFINIGSLFLMMLPGYILIRKNILSTSALKDFSHVIVKVLYPCLIFSSMTRNYTIEGVLESWQLPVAAFIILFVGYIIGLTYNGFFGSTNVESKKSMLFQFTINNYSFLPLAIIAKLYDESHMAALILSTLGSEITVWTLGMAILNTKGKRFDIKSLKHLWSPPLVSIYFSLGILLGMHALGTSLNQIVNQHVTFKYINQTIYELGEACIPLSLIMIGGRMGKINFADLKSKNLWIVTLFRLIIVPLAAVLVIKLIFPNHPYQNVMLIVCVMPCAVASLVLGEIYGGDQKLLSGTVLITHIVALITIPAWLMFLISK
ncbi:AEC family transporter [Plebeiibacterium marinum]|uniref:AEC family transporter n=1 Tax=Plebeiibacterium marinum TaxID=2992111 RepID=A0AAE3MEV4_9BACT|nr:AEC family transporter [Plebeiobacterium marinum]MCW3806533.1 AEC family transporter [Plebeiobacterium marinum]